MKIIKTANPKAAQEKGNEMVSRVYVEKKESFAVKSKELLKEIKEYLSIESVNHIRILIRYDVENVSEDTYKKALNTVFCEPPVDNMYEEKFELLPEDRVFSTEFLPGQFDQRADSAVQCVKLLNESEEPVIKTATTYVISGKVSDEELEKIKKYVINPVDSRVAGEGKPETLKDVFAEPEDAKILTDFINKDENELKKVFDSLGLAMTFKDFLHIQNYFK
ncbi:MAG: phosphoribosylformylglycinamidine synthase, partial [Lachnospiraceae bacterium]|nr:phosphoribosylformylglycinamidine synthase [Lachnospiraceae bacterium]